MIPNGSARMLRIHGNTLSAPCNKVRYTCNLLEVAYEWIERDFRTGELRSPAYLALHPAGKVPVIEDDGFILFESEAICRYLFNTRTDALEKNVRCAALSTLVAALGSNALDDLLTAVDIDDAEYLPGERRHLCRYSQYAGPASERACDRCESVR